MFYRLFLWRSIFVGTVVVWWASLMYHRLSWNQRTTNNRLLTRRNITFFWRIWANTCDSIGLMQALKTTSKNSGKPMVNSIFIDNRRNESRISPFLPSGYRDDQLDRRPSNDPEAVKRRQSAVPMLIQCDKCLKWRRLPYSSHAGPLTQAQLETWRCSDNTDVMNNR